MSHLVSPCFANFPGGGAGVLCLFCLGGVCFVLFCFVVFWLPGELLPLISFLSYSKFQ